MNTHKLKLYLGFLCFALLSPTTTQAYFTTEQKAVKIAQDTVLYTVSYKFGFSDRELYMPIGAKRDVDTESNSPYVGYQILNENEVATKGLASGLVLTNNSDVQIKDNQYYLPAGKSATFTLVTLLTTPEKDNLSLLVSNLPFTMIDEGLAISAHLNPSELQYYKTPEISFD